MTREEAIEILSRPKSMKGVPDEILTAHAMAIRALEQQPCEDLINQRATTCRHGGHCEWVACDKCNHYEPDTLSQQPCDDCISRQSIKHKLQEHHDFFIHAYGGFNNIPRNDKSRVDEILNCIAMIVNEPPVTPKEKTGHWIPYIPDYDTEIEYYVCSECKNKCMAKTRYCYDCGCHMVEPQESENKEAQDGNS